MNSLQKTKLIYFKIQQDKLYETPCQFLSDLNAAEVEVCLLSYNGDAQGGVSTTTSMFVINSYQINRLFLIHQEQF